MSEYLTEVKFLEYMKSFEVKLEGRLTTLESKILNGHGKKECAPPPVNGKIGLAAVKYLGEGFKIVLAALLAALGIKYLGKW